MLGEKANRTLQPRCGCETSIASVPRVAEAATLGFEPQPLRGKE